MDLFKTTFHRNGDVTLWNVFTQTWERTYCVKISDAVLATLSRNERERISRMAVSRLRCTAR